LSTTDSPRLALGCGNFGGIGSAPEFFGQGESRDEAFAIMDAAWEAGIRWFDTADAYGGGRSEAWIGEWMASRGVRPRLTTKTFNPMGPDDPGGLAPARVRQRLAESLERLGVERVDLYLLHEADPLVRPDEAVATLEELRDEGRVAEIGVSNFTRELLREIERPIDWVQNSFSLLERGDEDTVMTLDVRYQAFSPLAGGWLAARYKRGEWFPPGSRMSLRPRPYAHYERDEVFDALDALAAAAAARGLDSAALALAWTLSHPGVDSVVLGPRRPQHLEPALRALELDLPPHEHAELGRLFP
jgi:aryl-alcohol dehydrogenase-like predicted oxidoreductase